MPGTLGVISARLEVAARLDNPRALGQRCLMADDRELPARPPAQPIDERIARALQRLRERPTDRWTVAALAKAAGLSRAAFARRFLSELGVPPLRYLAEVRMDLAARLLAEGDASLALIAARVGYESEFAFSRAFKRRTGEAPGVYRRRRRAERATVARVTFLAVAAAA
jgi:AraC-like DNA-binding protein